MKKNTIPDFKTQLLSEMGRKNMNIVVSALQEKPEYFPILIDYVESGDHPLPLRASWAMTIFLEQDPDSLLPYLKRLIPLLPKFEHPGIRRCVLRSIAGVEIPKKWHGYLVNYCFDMLLNQTEPTANRVYAMQILYTISLKEPSIKEELADSIRSVMPSGTPGIQSKGNKILQLLRKK